MPVGSGMTPDPGSFSMLIVLVAGLCVIFWRMALRIMATVFIALAVYGAVFLTEWLHHTGR